MFKGFQPRADIQNYTMIPNEFFDAALANIDSLAELKVILAIFRKTYGWIDRIENGVPIYKIEDDISYSQFKDVTGLSDSSVSDGIKRSEAHGFVERVKTGGLNGGCSRYRIMQKSRIQEHEPSPLDNDALLVTEKSTKVNTPIQKAVLVDNTPPSPSDKEEILAELIGGKTTDEPPPFKKPKGAPTTKPLQKWNCNDLLTYFGQRYRVALGIPYAMVSGKDRTLAKRLIETGELDMLSIIKAIDYYLKNYRSIKGLPEGFPSWAVFYGWRNTIIPMALVGDEKAATGHSKKNMGVREYQEPVETPFIAYSWDGLPLWEVAGGGKERNTQQGSTTVRNS